MSHDMTSEPRWTDLSADVQRSSWKMDEVETEKPRQNTRRRRIWKKPASGEAVDVGWRGIRVELERRAVTLPCDDESADDRRLWRAVFTAWTPPSSAGGLVIDGEENR